MIPYCDEIMTVLLENLSNNEVHRLVKPQILSVFGDVALAVGNKFSKYLEVVLQTLREASNAQVDRVSSDSNLWLLNIWKYSTTVFFRFHELQQKQKEFSNLFSNFSHYQISSLIILPRKKFAIHNR